MAKRCHIHIRSSSTRRIDTLSSNQVIDENYGSNPENGDVVIGEVCELGQHSKFEEPGGREIKLQRGNVVAAVLGRRYSTKEFCGKIPDNLTLQTKFDLLNVGGIAGIVLSHNTLSKVPTKLYYLGHAVDDQKKKINTLKYRMTINENDSNALGRSPLKIIIVFGTEMDSGKTSSAGQIINILRNNGFTVGGGKLTGTSRMKDILYMKACGAHHVLDFMDAGYPSTYQCTLRELEDIFQVFKGYFTAKGCDFLVMEVADGIFQRETEMILNCPSIMEGIFLFTLAANDSLSAYGGLRYLQEKYAVIPDFISGLITTDWLSMEELRSKVSVHYLTNTAESREDFLQIVYSKK